MSIKKINLNSQLINKITDQQQTQKVYKLNCTSFNISKIQSSIKKYQKLRCLILDFNFIDRIQNINSLFDLRQLHLQGNLIQKIVGLQTCKNITLLNLAQNKITVIQNISYLGKLQNLNLSKNKIQKISNLQTLKQLKFLNLSFNQIISLNSLPSFSKLQTLLLNNNKIQSIPQGMFNNSTKLIKLDLSCNKIVQCSFISKLTNLQILNLSHNKLKSFTVQNQLKFLQQLNLQANDLQSLPSLGQYFPQLIILNINYNMFCSQHQFITMLSQSQMITQIQFINNPIHNQTFQGTLNKLFNLQRINKKNYSQPGTKYLQEINTIQRDVKCNFADIEDDEDDRKIRMSGFYNQDLQTKMTGIKPHRAVSPATKKAKVILQNNQLTEIQKNYNQFLQNDKRIKSLRQMYESICLQNNIQKPIIQPLVEDDSQVFFTQQKNQINSTKQLTSFKSKQQIAELRLRNDNNEKLMNAAIRQKSQKWSQLKARTKQKSFNIRKSSRKQTNGSLSKISVQIGQKDLMKTQIVPTKFLNSIVPGQRKTANLFYRPNSQKG